MICKLKNCDGCQTDKPIWKNHEGNKYCKYCWAKIKKPKPIKKMSDHKKEDYELYKIAREQHFKDFPKCQFNGCVSGHIQLHHMAGRVGELLYNRKYFKSLCDKHHRFVTENPEKGIELGLCIKSTTKNL